MEGFFPQVVFSIFGVPVRDTVVSTWIMMTMVVGLAVVIGRRRPTALEMLVDFLNDTISDILRRPAEPYLPLLGALAIFIAVANIISVVPFLVSPTRDINTPAALALVVFFSVHYFGIRSQGVVGYFKDLATPVYVLPLVGFSMFTGLLQAYIFTALATVYIGAGLEASEPTSSKSSSKEGGK